MKSKTTAMLLALFVGGIGVHKFYLRKPVGGIFYLMFCWTFVPVFLGFIDFLILAVMSDESFNKKYNQ